MWPRVTESEKPRQRPEVISDVVQNQEKKVKERTAEELERVKTKTELEAERKKVQTPKEKVTPPKNQPIRKPIDANPTNPPKNPRVDVPWGRASDEDLPTNESFVYDMTNYKVIHIPQSADGTNNCSGIARRNQQKILAWTPNADFILFGNASDKIELFQKLYARSGKKPWESIKVLEVFGTATNPIQRYVTFTWLHDDREIIAPGIWFQIEKLLDKSRKYVTTDAPCVREAFIDTEHKHRVTIVYGTGTYTKVQKMADGSKKITKETYTGYWIIDTLRGRWKSGWQSRPEFGKVPLPVYFSEANKFYFTRRGAREQSYNDIFVRSLAPIGFEPQGGEVMRK